MMKARIGYYLSTFSMGGMEQQVLTLIDHAPQDSYDVTVFCNDSEWLTPFFEELKLRGIPVIITGSDHTRQHEIKAKTLRQIWQGLPLRQMKRLIRHVVTDVMEISRLRTALAAAKLDVIHFHAGWLEGLYPPLIASRLAGIPIRLLSVHNSVEQKQHVTPAIERLALRSSQHLITASEYVKRSLETNKQAPTKRVVIIPYGIDLPAMSSPVEQAQARATLKLPDTVPVVGSVARLVPLKGHDLLIRAAARVKAQVKNVRLVIIGEGPEEEALRELAERHGVSEIVTFAGYQSNARFLMPALNVLAGPSRDEGFSICSLEAMACGKPIVATRVGGIPSVVIDGVTGLLVPSEDVSALSEALIRLLNDPAEAERMGQAGRERVRSHFLRSQMIDRTFALYRGPAKHSPPTADSE